MLRLCLILSVLLGLQVAGTGADQRMKEACMSMMCPPLKIVVHDSYEELYLPRLQWLYAFINGTDLKTATDVALDKFFDYAQFNNAADTIVPISAPWMVYAPFDNGIIHQEYSFLISLPLEVQSPPEPSDPSVHVHRMDKIIYFRTYQEKTEDYERLANEFKKDLENDQRSFYSNRVYLARFNNRGLFKIGFQKK